MFQESRGCTTIAKTCKINKYRSNFLYCSKIFIYPWYWYTQDTNTELKSAYKTSFRWLVVSSVIIFEKETNNRSVLKKKVVQLKCPTILMLMFILVECAERKPLMVLSMGMTHPLYTTSSFITENHKHTNTFCP